MHCVAYRTRCAILGILFSVSWHGIADNVGATINTVACSNADAEFTQLANQAIGCLQLAHPTLNAAITHLDHSTNVHFVCPPADPERPINHNLVCEQEICGKQVCPNPGACDPKHTEDGVGVPTYTEWEAFPPGGCSTTPGDRACGPLHANPSVLDHNTIKNPVALLAHELWHAYLADLGDTPPKKVMDPCSRSVELKETQAVDIENIARTAAEDCIRALGGATTPRTVRDNEQLCVCGNNRVDAENVETCDGTANSECSGRGCYPPGHDKRCTCKPPPTCGDGEIDPSREECDPGDVANGIPANAPSCPLHCTPPTSRVPCKCRPKYIIYDASHNCAGGGGLGGGGTISNNCIEVWGPSLGYSPSGCTGTVENNYMAEAKRTLSIPPCPVADPYCCESLAAKATIWIDPASFYTEGGHLDLWVATAGHGSCAERIGQCCPDLGTLPGSCGGSNGAGFAYAGSTCACPVAFPNIWPFHACPPCP